jgi:cytochrome c553
LSDRNAAAALWAAAFVSTATVCMGVIPSEAAEAPPGAASCSGCHPAGTDADTPVPRLAGQDAGAIVTAMQAFRDGKRPATVMDRIARGFSDEEVKAMAEWFATQR